MIVSLLRRGQLTEDKSAGRGGQLTEGSIANLEKVKPIRQEAAGHRCMLQGNFMTVSSDGHSRL